VPRRWTACKTFKIRAILLGEGYFSCHLTLLKRNVLPNRTFIDGRCLQTGHSVTIGGGIWSRGEQPPAYTGGLHVLLVIHMRVIRKAEDPSLCCCLVVVFR